MNKAIFTGFSPNTTGKDVMIVMSYLVLPWKWIFWKKGKHVAHAEKHLSEYFDGAHVIAYDSGRSALYEGLLALGVGEGDEVLVQAFTCVVVINAIRWTGATPVYVDIDEQTLNMNPKSASEKVTPATRAMIIQHTFGLPANIESLMAIAAEHELKTIEDCAHSLGAMYKGKRTGTFADIGMLSFGGEKIISCVRGGALVTKSAALARKLRARQVLMPYVGTARIFQHLVHVIVFPLGKTYYHLFFGKALLKFTKTFSLTPRIISGREKRGEALPGYPARLPNVLAALLTSQFARMDSFNEHRKRIASLYEAGLHKQDIGTQQRSEEHVYLRYAVFVDYPEQVRTKAKQSNIILGDWYTPVVGPKDTMMEKTGYVPGSCPVAEEQSRRIVNLPTNIHISKQDTQRILRFITE